ncbi:hypothetical protein G3I40_29055 [Streptomyces sp. SID14478]|uniref:hypothetical protein n=1 Tax=Streptomyces sp. SID14478 TaxID=2706073 RepID=UPI0013D94500|nr:hypothetical protein [Streptomyces sp. SID14478]NEB79236.1 hypothetical protein [Streptomyces sp. SID14478]
MPPLNRLLTGAVAVATALGIAALMGCGRTDGLGAGEAAPSVSVQPQPHDVWPAWSGTSTKAPGAEASTHQPPPKALTGLPLIGAKGLRGLDAHAVLRADPRMQPFAGREDIKEPGVSGVRPPMYRDLTGDGRPELLVAVDTESGRTALSVYTERDGRVYPVLFTGGKRVAVETLGKDLLLRSSCTDGGEQAVRYHWDGTRLSTISDVKNYKKSTPTPSTEPDTTTSPSPGSAS